MDFVSKILTRRPSKAKTSESPKIVDSRRVEEPTLFSSQVRDIFLGIDAKVESQRMVQQHDHCAKEFSDLVRVDSDCR